MTKLNQITEILQEIKKHQTQRKTLPIKCDTYSREYIKYLERKIEEIHEIIRWKRMTKPYTINGTIVTGEGHSYKLNNKYDATNLCETLNDYHKRATRMTKPRYTIENEYYILDNYTGKHIDLKTACQLLNYYERGD